MADNQKYRAVQEHMHQCLSPWQPLFVTALVKYESLPKAAKAVGISRELALSAFRDTQFTSLLEAEYHASVTRALEQARALRETYEMKSYKGASIKSAISKLDRIVSDLLVKEHARTTDIFPELKVLLK